MTDPGPDSTPTRRPRGRPKAFHDKTEQNTIQSLDRAVSVLKHLAEHGGMALSELAKETDQSPATLYRVLTTFQQHDFAEFDDKQQIWNVGSGAYRVGSAFLRRSSLLEVSRPILRELMQETRETANLGMERNELVLFVFQVETHESIRAFFPPGTQSKMHASGIGKALLAHFPPERFEDWLARHGLEEFTDKTLIKPEALRADLAQTRARGSSFDDEERNIGMRCIAAPVFNAFGEPIAGVSVSGPVSRMHDGKLDEIAAAVRKAANKVTTAIGGTR